MSSSDSVGLPGVGRPAGDVFRRRAPARGLCATTDLQILKVLEGRIEEYGTVFLITFGSGNQLIIGTATWN